MAGAHLTRGEHAFRSVIKPHQDRCQIIDSNIDSLQIRGACSLLKGLARHARLLSLRDDCCDVSKDMRYAQAGDVLREITPMRSNVTQRR